MWARWSSERPGAWVSDLIRALRSCRQMRVGARQPMKLRVPASRRLTVISSLCRRCNGVDECEQATAGSTVREGGRGILERALLLHHVVHSRTVHSNRRLSECGRDDLLVSRSNGFAVGSIMFATSPWISRSMHQAPHEPQISKLRTRNRGMEANRSTHLPMSRTPLGMGSQLILYTHRHTPGKASPRNGRGTWRLRCSSACSYDAC